MSITISAARNEFRLDRLSTQSGKIGSSANDGDETLLKLGDHLAALRQYASRQHFKRNETVFCEDDPADRVYTIVSGIVRLCRHTPDGRRCIIDFLLPGDLIGLLVCADQPATAEAVTEATLVSYPRSAFDRLAASDSAIRRSVLRHLSASLIESQHHLFVLGSQNAKQRVASFFLRMFDRMDGTKGDALDVAMGRQGIADHLGLTIETVCRAITALRCSGIIDVPNSRQIALLDTRALRALVSEG
jgi:CRP-like cAMP-binding protein